jgi:hypothetical protein
MTIRLTGQSREVLPPIEGLITASGVAQIDTTAIDFQNFEMQNKVQELLSLTSMH